MFCFLKHEYEDCLNSADNQTTENLLQPLQNK